MLLCVILMLREQKDASIGEDHTPETHIVPIILQVALGQRAELSIFGDDYDTPDGTCIRDYVYIEDLIAAHILALEYLKMAAKVTSLTWVATTAILLKKC